MVTVEPVRAVWRPLAESIVEILGIDSPDAIRVVSRQHLDQWGVTDPGPLFARGRANVLARRAPDTFVVEDVRGLQLLRADGPEGFETSWVLLPEVVRPLTSQPSRSCSFRPGTTCWSYLRPTPPISLQPSRPLRSCGRRTRVRSPRRPTA
jgi:hypothetical protein